jgi:hypothetical protein
LKRFFFEKRSKKLSLLRVVAMAMPQPAASRSFFAYFFSKKEALTSYSAGEAKSCLL